MNSYETTLHSQCYVHKCGCTAHKISNSLNHEFFVDNQKKITYQQRSWNVSFANLIQRHTKFHPENLKSMNSIIKSQYFCWHYKKSPKYIVSVNSRVQTPPTIHFEKTKNYFLDHSTITFFTSSLVLGISHDQLH